MAKPLRASTLLILSLATIGCNVKDPPPFRPLGLQRQERELAGQIPQPPMGQFPTSFQSPYAPYAEPRSQSATQPVAGPDLATAPSVHLSLQELVQRSVTNSHEVRVSGYDPGIEQTRIVEAQARFDPTFFTNTQYERRDNWTGGITLANPSNPFQTPLPTFFEDKTRTFTVATGVRQQLESGGQAELRYQAGLTQDDPQRTVMNPFYTSELILEVTQPLLRDFGQEVNRARITIARNTHKVSVLEFRNTLEKNIAQIEQTYWQLVQAYRDVQTFQELLNRTEQTADILSKRFNQDATRESISQSIASVEARRASLVRAKQRVGDLSDQLKRLVNDPNLPVTSGVIILPDTPPTLDPITFDLHDQINTAMDSRAELSQQQLRIDNASIVLGVAKNNLLPQLNFITQLGVQGGNETYGEAIERNFDQGRTSYRVGLQLEVPIGNRAARAIYQRSLLQRQQAIESYQNVVSQVSQEVKQTLRDVHASWQEIVFTRRAVFAAADALASIQFREESGQPLTPEFVELKLSRQQDLANNQQSYNQAVAAYNVAITNLERAKGTLLRYNNILLQEDRLPFNVRVAIK
jgi:outer membrane protein TolC